MKRYLLFIFIIFFCHYQVFPQFSLEGTGQVPYEITPSGNGINKVYLLNGLSGAYLKFISNYSSITFYKFTNGLESQQLIPSSDIAVYSQGGQTIYEIRNLENGKGYLAEEESKAVWIIDYSLYIPSLNSIEAQTPEDEGIRCVNEIINLMVDKSEPQLFYYNISGNSPVHINREYSIEYTTQEWDEDNERFIDQAISLTRNIVRGEEVIPAPLRDTYFTVKGDQFARHFGMDIQGTSQEEYQAVVVDVRIVAIPVIDGIEADRDSISTSAPLEMNFYGYANDAARHFEWRIYHSSDPDNWLLERRGETMINYTFTQAGNYTILFEASSAGNACIKEARYELSISESELIIPNFFSPGDTPGINDVFKVQHKSLIKFKATIFNRWGNKLYEWSDPDEGWDGTYKRKLVSPGVYFYVIEATGSDGIKYKKGGDINILRSR